MNKRHWLEITEYVLLGFSIMGTVVAGVTQQVIYPAVPLSLSIALNLANWQKFNPVHACNQRFAELDTSIHSQPALDITEYLNATVEYNYSAS